MRGNSKSKDVGDVCYIRYQTKEERSLERHAVINSVSRQVLLGLMTLKQFSFHEIKTTCHDAINALLL